MDKELKDILHRIVDHLSIHDARKAELHNAIGVDDAGTDTRAGSTNSTSGQ